MLEAAFFSMLHGLYKCTCTYLCILNEGLIVFVSREAFLAIIEEMTRFFQTRYIAFVLRTLHTTI